MAKIALMVGFAALGAVTGGLGWLGFLGIGASASFLGGAITGGMLGLSVGGALGTALIPGPHTNAYGPRLNDLQVSSSTPGAAIPICYGQCRYAGQIIWTPLGGMVEHYVTTTESSKGVTV